MIEKTSLPFLNIESAPCEIKWCIFLIFSTKIFEKHNYITSICLRCGGVLSSKSGDRISIVNKPHCYLCLCYICLLGYVTKA